MAEGRGSLITSDLPEWAKMLFILARLKAKSLDFPRSCITEFVVFHRMTFSANWRIQIM